MKAESSVRNLEVLPLGELWRESLAAAEAAIDSARATADARVFAAEFVPVSADTIALCSSLVENTPPNGYGETMAAFHGRAVATHAELARCLRSPECLADIAGAAARVAAPVDTSETHAAAGNRVGAAAVARYKRQVALQLAAVDGHELQAAAQALVDLDALAARVDAARLRHEGHARGELERVRAEQEAAEAAIATDHARRVQELRAQAAAAAAAAMRLQNEIRRARGTALCGLLEAKLARSKKPERLMIRTSRLYSNVVELARALPHMSMEQIEQYEAAIASATFTEDGPSGDPWRLA